jgi:antitoxin HicB
MTQADDFSELGEMIQDAMRAWVETSIEEGLDIPAPRPVERYSGKFIVRVPKSLHRELIQAAERDGVSLNAFVNVALAKAVGEKSSARRAIVIPQQDSARYRYSDNRLLQESAHQIREEETGEE